MKNYIVYDKLSGEIIKSGICLDNDFYLQAFKNQCVIEGTGNVFSKYVLNETLIEYTDEQKLIKSQKPAYFCKWSNETFNWIDLRDKQEKQTEIEFQIKYKRNILLAESDWTQLPDVPLSNKNEWASYRQQLRDITMQSGYPFDVIFPKPPLP